MPQEERDLWSSSDLTPVLTLTRSRGSQIRHVVAEVESSCFLSHPAQSPNLHKQRRDTAILLPCSPICPPVSPTDKSTS